MSDDAILSSLQIWSLYGTFMLLVYDFIFAKICNIIKKIHFQVVKILSYKLGTLFPKNGENPYISRWIPLRNYSVKHWPLGQQSFLLVMPCL